MHHRLSSRLLVIAAVLASTGFASAASKQKVAPTIVPDFDQPDLSAANSTYKLSPEDLKLDCKKLTGRMQVRILQLRDDRRDHALGRKAAGATNQQDGGCLGRQAGVSTVGGPQRPHFMLGECGVPSSGICQDLAQRYEYRVNGILMSRPAREPR